MISNYHTQTLWSLNCFDWIHAKNDERHASCTTWSEEISKSQSSLANHMVIVIISIFTSFSSVPVFKRNEHAINVSTIEELGKSTGINIVQDI